MSQQQQQQQQSAFHQRMNSGNSSSSSSSGRNVAASPPEPSAFSPRPASAASSQQEECDNRLLRIFSNHCHDDNDADDNNNNNERSQLSTSSIGASEALRRLFEPSIVCGLANIGNTCFANSALQTLCNIPAVVGGLRFVCRFGVPRAGELGVEQAQQPVPAQFSGSSGERVTRATVATLHAMEAADAQADGQFVLAPKHLVRAVGDANESFAEFGAQHDAAEWLLQVLDSCADYHTDKSITAKDLADAYRELRSHEQQDQASSSPSAGAAAAASAAAAAASDSSTRARMVSGLAWSSHSRHAVWQAMARIDEDNAKQQYGDAKAQRAKALATGSELSASVAAAASLPFEEWRRTKYFSAFVPRSAAGDGVTGLMLTEVNCHGCGFVSKSFSNFTSLQLAFPSAAERSAYRAMVQAKKAETDKQQQQQLQQQRPKLVADTTSSGSGNGAVSKTSAGTTSAVAESSNNSGSNKKNDDDPKALAVAATGNSNGSNSKKNKDETETCGPDSGSSLIWKILFLPCAVVSVALRAIARFCSAIFGTEPEEPLTLDELIWQYTRGHQLRGSNEYNCSGCKQRKPALMQLRFLDLPQTMVFHLKRFEQSPYGGLWTQKIPDFVEFPGSFDPSATSSAHSHSSSHSALENQSTGTGGSNAHHSAALIHRFNSHLEAHRIAIKKVGSPLSTTHAGNGSVLDLSPFVAEPQDLLPPEDRDGGQGRGVVAPNNWAVPRLATYSLSAVINHHGGFGSGHYTAFARKLAEVSSDSTNGASSSKPLWGLFNDHRASMVTEQEVASSQAYVLTYHKQALVQEGAEMLAARRLAQEYLVGWRKANNNNTNNRHDNEHGGVIALPRLWLFRIAAFAEPGPLLHRAAANRQEELQRRAAPEMVVVAQQDAEALIHVFGELRLPPAAPKKK